MANRLSKSRFQTGLQCPKALWLSTHQRELADPTPDTQQHIFDTGTAVGELARERFAGGVLVAEDYTESAQALETTRRLLEDPPNAIFEAAVEHEGVFVRPDVLVRVGENLWDLYEVKSGTRVKPVNITDVAVQTWVLEGAGLPIRTAYLMHLDNTYVYEGGDYDLERLFRAEDITAEARAYLPLVPDQVAEMLALLDVATPPSVIFASNAWGSSSGRRRYGQRDKLTFASTASGQQLAPQAFHRWLHQRIDVVEVALLGVAARAAAASPRSRCRRTR